MSNEAQYFNPIVAAIAHAQEMSRQKQMDAETIQQHALENRRLDLQQKTQQQLADLATKKADDEHELHLANIQHLADALAVQKNVMHTNLKQQMLENIQKGVAKPEAYQTPAQNVPDSVGLVAPGTAPGMINPGGGASSIPISSVGTPEEAQQRMLGIEQAQQNMKDASMRKTEQFKSDLQEQKDKANFQRIQQQGADRLKGIEAVHGLVAPGAETDALDIADNKINGILSGQTSYSSLSKDEKRVVDARAAQQKIILPTNQVQHSKNLGAVTSLDTLLGQAEDVIKKYSRDSPTQGDDFTTKMAKGIANLTGGVYSPNIQGSEAKSAIDQLQSSAGQLATTFDQNNRKNEAEILRSRKGIFDPAYTMKENLDRLDSKKAQLTPLIKQNFVGVPQDKVNDLFNQLGITHFNSQGPVPFVTPQNGMTLPKGQLPPGMLPPPPIPVPGQNAPPLANPQGQAAPQPQVFFHIKGPDGRYKLVPAPMPGGGQ